MKTRVLYKNGSYYPQRRRFGIYWYFCAYDEISGYYIRYKTLKEAQEHIERYFKNMKHKQTRQVFPYKTFKQYTDRVPRC